MRLAWGITGAGHHLKASFEMFRQFKQENPISKVSIFISAAGEEVLKMYGLFNLLDTVSPGGYMEEIFLESEQGRSYPKVGRFLMGKYDSLVITPATSNTVAKLAAGIADTLVTNAVTQAVKGSVPVFVVPVDVEGVVRSELPYNIDRDLCAGCGEIEHCAPKDNCPGRAITPEPQIDLLLCDGCGLCVKLCPSGAIRGGDVWLKVRDLDRRNLDILRGLDGITVVDHPQHLPGIILK